MLSLLVGISVLLRRTLVVFGPMYEIFGWTPALEVSNSTAGHKGDDVSVEAIAQTNPDWIFVLDRDAATSDAATSAPAKDVISKSPALQNTTAVSKTRLFMHQKILTQMNQFKLI